MKKILIVLITVLPLLVFGQTNKNFRKALRTADIEEKLKLLNLAIKENPSNLDAYFQRALVKNDLGDYSAAIVDYSKIILSKPDADSYFNRGNARFSLKDLEGAKSDYAKAFELDPYFVDALYSLACVKYDLEEYVEAIKDFNKVLKIAPNSPKVYMLRAASFKAIDRPKEALKDYSIAIYISPNANTYYNRGVFFMDINNYAKANKDLTKSIRINSNNTFAHFYRGVSFLLLGKYENALKDFSNALALDSLDFDAYIGLAITHHKMNNVALAKEQLKKANNILGNGEFPKLYENTFWYQNHYYFFTNNIKALQDSLNN
ncbi:tetratricopeptide repeat protein [Seonamhaeicola sp. ML3]|uniref:tetratricopeptide repeat protein n=1 Tax=Seonamhaeicola sp. ML3 TaxID=2937786 RepID=UPI00200FC288|nr:tetratricopeptide repeat protein [Seonamhaeicola sp. ML3]